MCSSSFENPVPEADTRAEAMTGAGRMYDLVGFTMFWHGTADAASGPLKGILGPLDEVFVTL